MKSIIPSRTTLKERIESLGVTEHLEIFRILKKHNVNYTPNNNGVFADISKIDDVIIKEISDFVTFCAKNNKDLEEYDKLLHQCKLDQNLGCMPPPPIPQQQQQHAKEDHGGVVVPPQTYPTPPFPSDVSESPPHHVLPVSDTPTDESTANNDDIDDDDHNTTTAANNDTSTTTAPPMKTHCLNTGNSSSSMNRFLETLENSMDTSHNRRAVPFGSAKYAAARKKYAKRVLAEAVNNNNNNNSSSSTSASATDIFDLREEPYLISSRR
jgi:hypothetical protein